MVRTGILRRGHRRLHDQFGRCVRERDTLPGADSHRRSRRRDIHGGGRNRHNRLRRRDRRHTAPRQEAGDTLRQQGGFRRQAVRHLPVLLARARGDIQHLGGQRQRDGRTARRRDGGPALRRSRRARPPCRTPAHRDRGEAQCRQVLAHQRPARRRQEHSHPRGRDDEGRGRDLLQQVRLRIHAGRHRRNPAQGQGARRPRVLLGDALDTRHRAFRHLHTDDRRHHRNGGSGHAYLQPDTQEPQGLRAGGEQMGPLHQGFEHPEVLYGFAAPEAVPLQRHSHSLHLGHQDAAHPGRASGRDRSLF